MVKIKDLTIDDLEYLITRSGRVPRIYPWVNKQSTGGRQAKLELSSAPGLPVGI